MSDQPPPSDPAQPGAGPSNPYGSPPPANPYGAPPPPSNPYGTEQPPPAGTPPQAGPYGAQQPVPYGATQPGQPYGAAAPRDPDKRPGTVLAASIITLVFSALGALVFAFGLVAVLVARDDILAEARKNADLSSVDGDQLVLVLAVVLAGFLLWCLSAIVISVLVLRRSKVARVLLVVSSALTALISLVGILSGISAITLIASIAVIVLLFTGGAGPWFARKGSDPQPPLGTTVY